MNRYIEEYQKRMAVLSSLEEKQKQSLEKAKQKYEDIKNNSTIDKKELRLSIAIKGILRASHVLERTLEERLYSRVGSEETEKEKTYIYDNFTRELRNNNSLDPNLCFHGCKDIALVLKIIESGELSSSSDRLGYETSYDVEDQVSVTTLESLDVTIQGYAGLTNPSSSPAGAVFVVTPKNDEEIESSRRLLIGNVDFKNNPNRLVSIITTEENKSLLVEACTISGIEADKVFTFSEYLEYAKKISKTK